MKDRNVVGSFLAPSHFVVVRLIEEVEKIQASFYLQDFRCPKTRFVSQRLASSLSPQSDPLVMDQEPRKVREQLELLLQVAELHQYGFLKEQINDILQQ